MDISETSLEVLEGGLLSVSEPSVTVERCLERLVLGAACELEAVSVSVSLSLNANVTEAEDSGRGSVV